MELNQSKDRAMHEGDENDIIYVHNKIVYNLFCFTGMN
jgi:hypothetical protein